MKGIFSKIANRYCRRAHPDIATRFLGSALSPSSRPSALGEGESSPAHSETERPQEYRSRQMVLPLPEGEGRGEGELCGRSLNVVVLRKCAYTPLNRVLLTAALVVTAILAIAQLPPKSPVGNTWDCLI